MNAGQLPERLPNGAHSIFVPAQIFRTRDGHVALFITHDRFWRTFANTVGRPDWLEDRRFASMAARRENRELVVESIQTELCRLTAVEWVDLLQPPGVVIAAISRLDDALSCENVAARGMVVSIDTPAGHLRLVGNPIKVDGFEELYRAPPRLGEDTVLLESPGLGR